MADPESRRWRLLQVEASFACNLECVMCPWRGEEREAENQGLMRDETWAAIVPHLPEIDAVDFTGGGEPTLHPRLPEWIATAHAAGCTTGFLSNGFTLDEVISRAVIDAGLSWICISMDGATADVYEEIRPGSDFATVTKNVERLGALRRNGVPKTMINFVMMPQNIHQAEDMVRLAARLGVDQVNLKQADVVRGRHGKGFALYAPEEDRAIRRMKKQLAKARKVAKKLGVATTAFSFTPREKPVCEQDPRSSMFVRYDGRVAGCIGLAIGGPTTFLGREVLVPTCLYGRLPDQDLLEIWEGDACRARRETRYLRCEEPRLAVANP